MKYKIPLDKLDRLEKYIERYQKKGGNFTYERGSTSIEQGTLVLQGGERVDIDVECVEVEVGGVYKVNGWQFVGILTPTKNGNKIDLCSSEWEKILPHKFYTCACRCEHCGTHRSRNATYIVYNKEQNLFKQVGKNCLLEYIDGFDASKCAEMMSLLVKFEERSHDYYVDEENFFIPSYSSSHHYGYNTRRAIKTAYVLIKHYGYSKETSDTLRDMFMNCYRNGIKSEKEPSDKEVDKIINHTKQFTESNNYLWNCRMMILNGYIKHNEVKLLCSYINTYLKDMAQLKLNKKITNDYVGSIGDRITISVVNARVLYTTETYYTYRGETQYVYELIDDKDNVFIWKSSNLIDFDNNNVIRATIKGYKEWKGRKQNIITRGIVQGVA